MNISVIIVVNVASIFACHYIAKRSGRKPVFWGLMGALFGPFAIPVLLLTKPRASSNKLS